MNLLKILLKVFLFITSPIWGILCLVLIVFEAIIGDMCELWDTISKWVDRRK